MTSGPFTRAVATAAMALGMSVSARSALAQNELGEVLDAGATKISADEFRRDVVQRTIVGLTPTGGTIEVVYTSNGAIAGSGSVSKGSLLTTIVNGEWKIDDRDRVCTTMRLGGGASGQAALQQATLTLPTRCQFWFKAGERYFLSESDSDREARVVQRSVKATIASFTAPTPGAQLTLPKSMKGTALYRLGFPSTATAGWSRPWSLSVTRTNDDGAFEGFVTFAAGDVAGRRCFANKTPVTNALVKDGEVRFDLSMGPQCSDNTFTLRKGNEHFLEGALVNKSVPEPVQLWLDPDQ